MAFEARALEYKYGPVACGSARWCPLASYSTELVKAGFSQLRASDSENCDRSSDTWEPRCLVFQKE